MILQQVMMKKGLYDEISKNVESDLLPQDDINLFRYHCVQLLSEIGEVLEADKRWKSHRNNDFSRDEKIKEIADCIAVIFNIAIFSGVMADELEKAIHDNFDKILSRICCGGGNEEED